MFKLFHCSRAEKEMLTLLKDIAKEHFINPFEELARIKTLAKIQIQKIEKDNKHDR